MSDGVRKAPICLFLPPARGGMRAPDRVTTFPLGSAALTLLWLLIGLARAADHAGGEQLLFLEPTYQKAFGPQKVTPRGTIFFIRVLKKTEHAALHLYRCGVPCKTARSVKSWAPGSYRAGELLSWASDEDGAYYFWTEDTRRGTSVAATAHEFNGKRIRIAFESGGMIEAWYVLP